MSATVRKALLVTVLLGLAGGAAAAPRLEPLVVGWERIFRLEWEVAERRAEPVVHGHIVNDSPYTVTAVRLLVEGLDPAGAIVAQQISWLPGDLTPFSRAPFEASAPGRHAAYRVRVFAFDRLESNGRVVP
jgi:hypothetical protein